ncbi:MAG: tetratricopeptide repeat protein [Deltaproteobacteria bacterium]|nr:tetratricopeptide repeat protein [Deltaproteobacteria bacterium]
MSRLSRRSSMLVVAAGLALARPAIAQSTAEAKSKVDLVELQLKEAEERLGFVEQEYVQRKDATDEQLRQERFAKGASAFADADYNSASILFYDLVENPAFKNDPNYDDAVYYLGESLYQQQNLLGARHFFRELLNLRRSHYRSALARYLEIAGKLNDFGDVAGYVDAARDAQGNLPAEVGYVYAKWLFKRQDIPLAQRAKEAQAVLKPIAEGNGDDRLAAMYLYGVLEVQQGNFDEATETYTHLTRIGSRNERERQIVELAHLALGRIAYEQSKFTEAIDAYQEVDRDSEHFTEALYEIAWVFVKKGEYEKALRSTEILDELAPDSIIAPEAKVLRAHLYLKLTRYADATQTYKDVINAYAPVRDEVDALLKLHDDPVKYFDDLLAQNDKDFNVTSLLPPAAAKWATTQQDVAEAMRVSGDLGASRKGVDEGNDLAQQILKQIDEKGANAFPVLQEGFSKAEAVDATLTNDSQLLVDAQRLIVESKVGDLAVELEAARKEREALEQKFKTLPQSDQDLATRKARYQNRLDAIDHTAFQLQNQIEAMNAALASIEKWVVDTRAERTNDPAAEKKFLADVKDVRGEVADLSKTVAEVRQGIKNEKLRSGNATADDQVRAQYQQALDREKAVLAQAASRLGPDDQALAERIAGVQKRVEGDRARVASAKLQLQTAVANKAENIRRQVEEEQNKLRGYSGEVDNVAGNARNLVGRIAYDSFKRVRKQFYDMVLKADVGMVDVAWTKKQDDTNKIQELSKNKDKELKSLDDEFKEVLKDVD